VKSVSVAVLVWFGAVVSAAAPVPALRQAPPRPAVDPASGEGLFAAQCGFCHGRDATGGQTGPDLTDSDLVGEDVNGDKIAPVVHNGRPEKGMPPFAAMSETDLKKIVDYIHKRKSEVDANPGRRRKVNAADLSTGDVEAGRRYFDGPGGCKDCHSPTGDLAGVSVRYRGLGLMQRLLYPSPNNVAPALRTDKPKPTAMATVRTSSGQTFTGGVTYRDEFTLSITEANGAYHSWPTADVTFTIKDSLQAHADLLSKYTDADIHNLFAYLQSIK
jgi:cytochrome c oxidase cbb3-type subunit 3